MTRFRATPRPATSSPCAKAGSLPAVVDTDGGGLFVVKFRGAGQGAKALIAELIVGLLAQALQLARAGARARRALRRLRPQRARSRDPGHPARQPRRQRGAALPRRRVQLRRRRRGRPGLGRARDAGSSGSTRSSPTPTARHRNPNLLVWRRRPWLIDHGGALYAHHDWSAVDEARTRDARSPASASTSCSTAPTTSPRWTRGWPARSRPTSSSACSPRCPTSSTPIPSSCREFSSAEAARARYARVSVTRLGAAARLRRRGRSAPATSCGASRRARLSARR